MRTIPRFECVLNGGQAVQCLGFTATRLTDGTLCTISINKNQSNHLKLWLVGFDWIYKGEGVICMFWVRLNLRLHWTRNLPLKLWSQGESLTRLISLEFNNNNLFNMILESKRSRSCWNGNQTTSGWVRETDKRFDEVTLGSAYM